MAIKYLKRCLTIVILYILSISCNFNQTPNFNNENPKLDSISHWLNQSKVYSIGIDVRKDYLSRAYIISKSIDNDSIKNKNLLNIAFQAYKLNDSLVFMRANLEAFELSEKRNDINNMALSNWNYGLYYGFNEDLIKSFFHYQKAYQLYQSLDKEFFEAKMLYNIAIIQKDVRDYTGSEISAVKAIKIFKELKKPLNLFYCYNLLGVVYNDMQELDNAITYHTKAVEILNRIDNNKRLNELSLNNLGLLYSDKKNYVKAIDYFEKVLESIDFKSRNSRQYSRILDNLVYVKFLNGNKKNILEDLQEALRIRDSLNNLSGIVISKLHLAEYHAKYSDTLKAIQYAQEAGMLAKTVNNNRDRLASLKLLSQIDPKKGKGYLDQYIVLNDSLQIQERKLRNKFTRIRFETDEYIEEKEKLSSEYLNFVIVSSVVLFILGLFYIIRVQRSKNKSLLFEKEQQNSNEEIYKLLLKQQSKIEEGRLKERNRISEELHDGVLGKIFGTRLSFGFLPIKGDDDTLKKHGQLVNELQDVEREIRNISHELKSEILASHQNFNTIVEELVQKQSKIGNYNYKISFDKVINWNIIDGTIKINCYRIIQEALQNCNKHAKASELKIDFSSIKKSLKLTIKDNGIGFNEEKKARGIGLKNIKSRTLKMHGKFTINSSAESGTILTIIIPL